MARKRFEPAAWNLGRWSPFLGLIACLYILFLISVLVLPQLYPVTVETLNYAPITIGIVTVLSAGGWLFPKWGAMYWFEGPKKTIQAEEERAVEAERRASAVRMSDEKM